MSGKLLDNIESFFWNIEFFAKNVHIYSRIYIYTSALTRLRRADNNQPSNKKIIKYRESSFGTYNFFWNFFADTLKNGNIFTFLRKIRSISLFIWRAICCKAYVCALIHQKDSNYFFSNNCYKWTEDLCLLFVDTDFRANFSRHIFFISVVIE